MVGVQQIGDLKPSRAGGLLMCVINQFSHARHRRNLERAGGGHLPPPELENSDFCVFANNILFFSYFAPPPPP